MIDVKNSVRCAAVVLALSVLASRAFAAVPVIDSSTEDFTTTVDIYDYFIDASDSPASFTASNLPAGLALNGSTGEIKGTVMTPGTYTIMLSATNIDGTGTSTLLLYVLPPPPFITSPTTASGSAGIFFSYQIVAQGNPIGFDISDFPPGLDFDYTTGILSGTPTIGGTFFLTIDAYNDGGDCYQDLTVTIAGPLIAITSDLTDSAQVGNEYEYDIFTDGEDAVSFTVTGLPSGLNADGDVISGTPLVAGTYNVVITATSVNGNTDTKTLVLTVQPKDQPLGPQQDGITADPPSAFIGDEVIFDTDAFDPDGNDVTITWNFGDGATDSGFEVVHTYTTAGTFTVTATSSNGTQSSSQTLQYTVTTGNANAPVASGIVATPNPASIGQAVAFSAQAADPNNDKLTFSWNFGDRTPAVTGPTPTHSYAKQGAYNVTLMVRDATGLVGRPFTQAVYVFNTTGLDNITEGVTDTNPLNGLSQTVAGSDSGIFDLTINVDALNRDAFEVSTDFDGMTRNAVKGMVAVAKAPRPGIYIATTTARDKATRTPKGMARKTLPVSRKELGLPPLVTAEPVNHKLSFKNLKGKFTLPSSTNIGGRIVAVPQAATRAAKSKPDAVTASGIIEMPAGLDLSQPQSVNISIGNLVDRLVLNTKGQGKGLFTQMTLKTRVNKKSPKTVAGQMATFSVKVSTAQMVQRGYGTDGVGAGQPSSSIKIQSALIIGGVTYALDQPVTLKVSGDSATIAGRSGL